MGNFTSNWYNRQILPVRRPFIGNPIIAHQYFASSPDTCYQPPLYQSNPQHQQRWLRKTKQTHWMLPLESMPAPVGVEKAVRLRWGSSHLRRRLGSSFYDGWLGVVRSFGIGRHKLVNLSRSIVAQLVRYDILHLEKNYTGALITPTIPDCSETSSAVEPNWLGVVDCDGIDAVPPPLVTGYFPLRNL